MAENDIAYTSKSKIVRIKGPHRHAYIPQVKGHVDFGVHSEIAEHYGVDTNIHNPHATTIDYLIAATAG